MVLSPNRITTPFTLIMHIHLLFSLIHVRLCEVGNQTSELKLEEQSRVTSTPCIPPLSFDNSNLKARKPSLSLPYSRLPLSFTLVPVH